MARRKLTAAAVEQLGEPWISPRTGKAISGAQARRYAVAGISREAYESGERVSTARGHSNERAERERRARGIYNDPVIRQASRRGLIEDVPLLTEFSREQQKEIATAYLATFMRDEFKRSKTVQYYLETHPGREAFQNFAELLDFMQEPPSGFEGLTMTSSRAMWEGARDTYNKHVGFILHGAGWKPSDRQRKR